MTKRRKPERCDVTLTERFEVEHCECDTYPDNLGPCSTYLVGANGQCVYCDHTEECHRQVKHKTGPYGAIALIEVTGAKTWRWRYDSSGKTRDWPYHRFSSLLEFEKHVQSEVDSA